MNVEIAPLDVYSAIVEGEGRPTPQFILSLNSAFATLAEAINSVAAAQAAADAANAAAETAQTAADTANTAATTAQASADSAQAVADAQVAKDALTTSTVSGLTLTATDAGADVTVSISGHTRNYGDGTSASVTGGSLTGLSYSTQYWIYYDDAARTGGAVTYVPSTSPVGNGSAVDRHLVGTVTTPAAAASPIDGVPVLPPGAWYFQ